MRIIVGIGVVLAAMLAITGCGAGTPPLTPTPMPNIRIVDGNVLVGCPPDFATPTPSPSHPLAARIQHSHHGKTIFCIPTDSDGDGIVSFDEDDGK